MPPKLYAALLCRKESLPVGTVIVELKTVISIYLQVPINNPAYYLIVLLINMKDNVYFLVYMLWSLAEIIKTTQENVFKVQSRYTLNPDEIITPATDLAEGAPLGNIHEREWDTKDKFTQELCVQAANCCKALHSMSNCTQKGQVKQGI